MSDIKTWIERCEEHPDHQSGMISEGMIRARMCEEIDDLRAEIERLKPLALGGWAGDSDPAAVLSKVEKQRAEIERLREAFKNIAALDPDVPDALVADALRVVVAQMGDFARAALEGKL